MEVTEVRVKLLPGGGGGGKLRGFCSITIDDEFVVRDLKIIEGTQGLFVAMPSRKLMSRCSQCGGKNHLRARFCNECGNGQQEANVRTDVNGRARLHVDVAHPINVLAREKVHRRVVKEFEAEIERSRGHGYRFATLEEFDDWDDESPGTERSAEGGAGR